MFTLSRPLGRLPFLAGVSVVNIAIAAAATLALTLLPASGFSMAAFVIVAALQGAWLVLHARRFADAGRGPAWPLGLALVCFGVFAFGYILSASLWSVPEVQQEAFRTAGGIGDSPRTPMETYVVISETGRALVSFLGAAAALVVTGLVAVLFLVVAAVSAVFSTVTLMLASGNGGAVPPLRQARTQPYLRQG